MGLFFKKKIKNSSDNNITINTSQNVLFDVGKELGAIREFLLQGQEKFNMLNKKVNNHEKRIVKLEGKHYENKKK